MALSSECNFTLQMNSNGYDELECICQPFLILSFSFLLLLIKTLIQYNHTSSCL